MWEEGRKIMWEEGPLMLGLEMRLSALSVICLWSRPKLIQQMLLNQSISTKIKKFKFLK